MSVTVSAVRALLLADAQGIPLPMPQPIDLAEEALPFGVTVRFEVEVVGEPVHPLWVDIVPPGAAAGIWMLPMLPVEPEAMTFAAEVRLPWGLLHASRPIEEQTLPPLFPLTDWDDLAGDYQMKIKLWPLASLDPDSAVIESVDFRIGDQPYGGTAPSITSVSAAPQTLLVGQPWPLEAVVSGDAVAVFFTTVVAGQARWGWLKQTGPGIWSTVRVGGDWYDRPDIGGSQDRGVVMSLQAVDLSGNWSDPVEIEYLLAVSQPALWSAAPHADAPNILAAAVSRANGLIDTPLLSSYCDQADAYVCARMILPPNEATALTPNGEGIFSRLQWVFRAPGCNFVFYAVPTDGSTIVGEKQAVYCPALGEA